MRILRCLPTLLAAAFLAGCGSQPAPQAAQLGDGHKRADRPNIVILLADDMGYGDLGVQGGAGVLTPRIDRLASEGVRLTDYYANHPVCAPSRAALMTGKYQQRFGFENNSPEGADAPPNYGVPLNESMLPELLKARGYATGMFGKWHIGFTPDKTPPSRGFDAFYGFLGGAMAYTPDGRSGKKNLIRGREPAPMPAHTTEAFADEAISFIKSNVDKPFFLYVPFNAVHAPMQSTKAYIDRFSSEPDPKRRVHLAMVAALDDGVGKIVDAIDANGLSENTLVVFISDNGGPTWQTTSSNGPLNGVKALVLEGGIRVPAIFRWKGTLPVNRTIHSVAMEFDVTATTQSLAGVRIRPDQDGVNLMPYLEGRRTGDVHDRLYWRANEQGAMRWGPWKMVKISDDYYLFDLRSDIGEHNNLAASQPAKLKELQDAWQTWSNAMMPAQWGSAARGPKGPVRGAALKDLVRRYVAGLPVSPETLLYGGGPEE